MAAIRTSGARRVVDLGCGEGKSNLIEAIELLHATPTKFAAAIQDGGGVHKWLWKGDRRERAATIEAMLTGEYPIPDLRYRLAFAAAGQRIEVIDEVLEETSKRCASEADVYFYYRYQAGRPVINTCQATTTTTPPPTTTTTTTTTTTGPQLANTRAFRQLTRNSLVPDESVLSQRKDPELYPELTWLGRRFDGIQTFREWSFGRYAAVRQPQPAGIEADVLLPDSRNLGLILNEIEHSDVNSEFNRVMTRFLPRYERFSTRIHGGTVQLYLRPDAVTLLADRFVSASQRTQVIVTTHSNALVSALSDHASSVGRIQRGLDSALTKKQRNPYKLIAPFKAVMCIHRVKRLSSQTLGQNPRLCRKRVLSL